MRNIFVLRRMKGLDDYVGHPVGHCSIKLNNKSIGKRIKSTKPIKVDYKNSSTFLTDEIKDGKFRQGWGFLGLDLNLPEQIWIENFIYNCHKYWGESINCGSAKGRYDILKIMLQIKEDDIVFLPKTPDNSNFMIATVQSNYYFDYDMDVKLKDFKNEFRHVIEISNKKTIPYSMETLEATTFGVPNISAVNKVKRNYKVYQILNDFLEEHYVT